MRTLSAMNLLCLAKCFALCSPVLLRATTTTATATAEQEDRTYIILGVSGTLEDGFPLRPNLDFTQNNGVSSKAILLGKGLVRGYKAYFDTYLDVLDDEIEGNTKCDNGGQCSKSTTIIPRINPVIFATGCHEHANQYSVYLVDARQAFPLLSHEPRFLSITPDTGMIDMTANETSPALRKFLRKHITPPGKSDVDTVAVPLVTGVWFNEQSLIPAPAIDIAEDGTEITNFPGSLAMWAKVKEDDLFKDPDTYWKGVRDTILAAKPEVKKLTSNEEPSGGPRHPFQCTSVVKFGVGPDNAKVTGPFAAQDLVGWMDEEA